MSPSAQNKSVSRTLPHRRHGPARWAVPLGILVAMLASAALLRWLAQENSWTLSSVQDEDRLTETTQAVLLGAACLMCLWAMIRSGPRQADFYWWVAPAFVCFFMCWREVEIDERYFHAHAFSWNYLLSASHREMTWTDRLILAVPSLAMTLTVLALCIRHLRMLMTTLRAPHIRISVCLFAAGIGFYLVAQAYDRGHGLSKTHGIVLPGFSGHRDDFWEEALELIGAAAIAMAALDALRRRPVISGSLAEARARLAATRRSPEPARGPGP